MGTKIKFINRKSNGYRLSENWLQRRPGSFTINELSSIDDGLGETLRSSDFEVISESNEPDIDTDHCQHTGRTPVSKAKHKLCIDCVKPVQAFKEEDIKVGDHIKFHGRIYDHHAIVVNVITAENNLKATSGKTCIEVVHASNTAARAMCSCCRPFASKARLVKERKQIDLKKESIMVFKYSNSLKHFPSEEIADRAIKEADIDPKEKRFKYHLFRNNCEHFATWCVTGEKQSLQVRKIGMTLRMFHRRGISGTSDGSYRNKMEYENEMLCKHCFERNEKLYSVQKKKIMSDDDVKAGDIIKYIKYRFWHTAVVLQIETISKSKTSLTCTIAHYAFRGLVRHREIREETLRIPFDGSMFVVDYDCKKFNLYDQEEVVRRARQRLGEKRYAHLSNNSGHFSRWCKLKLYNKELITKESTEEENR